MDNDEMKSILQALTEKLLKDAEALAFPLMPWEAFKPGSAGVQFPKFPWQKAWLKPGAFTIKPKAHPIWESVGKVTNEELPPIWQDSPDWVLHENYMRRALLVDRAGYWIDPSIARAKIRKGSPDLYSLEECRPIG